MRVFVGVVCLVACCHAQDHGAGLTGQAVDTSGRPIAGVLAELRTESAPFHEQRTIANAEGVYRFDQLTAGSYSLKLSHAGFRSLIVRSVDISEGEDRSLPVLQLEVGIAECSPHAVLDYMRMLRRGERGGDISGTVQVDAGPATHAVRAAEVTMMCGTGKVCGVTKTDSSGRFRFHALAGGSFSVVVRQRGFFPLTEPGFTVWEGLESIYFPIEMEICPRGICNTKLRKRRVGSCE